jgi:hypothetical protein
MLQIVFLDLSFSLYILHACFVLAMEYNMDERVGKFRHMHILVLVICSCVTDFMHSDRLLFYARTCLRTNKVFNK